MRSVFKTFRLVWGYWPQVLLYVLFNILTVIFSLFSIAMVIPFLRILFGMQQLVGDSVPFAMNMDALQHNFYYYLSKVIVENGADQALMIVSLIIVMAFLLRNVFTYLSSHYIAPVRNRVVEDMRNNLNQKILDLPLSYFSTERKGDLMSRMTNDAQEIDISVVASIQVMLKDPITIIVYLLSLFWMNPSLTLIIILAIPIMGFFLGRIARTLRSKSRVGQKRLGILTSVMDETLHGLRIIKAFNADRLTQEKFKATNRSFTKLGIKIFRRRSLAGPLTEFLSILILVLIMWFGASQVINGTGGLSPEVFIAYILIFSQIIVPAKNFTTGWYNVQKGLASLDRIEEVLNVEIQLKDAANAKEKASFDSEIRFNNVGFKYENDPVLREITLIIPKGMTLAVVGPSGAGKSTLADLVPRFFDVSSGAVELDGEDIRNYKIRDLRGLFGVVNQEPILFNDTFFNNIAFGKPDATIEEVEAAARVANAHEFIMETPEGYQTNIGDRGSRMSGGQRQRISIARAILKNPPILILDEATSSLDTENERMVQDALDKLMKNRTSIVIAHRLSTIVKADLIVVLDQGQVVERGTHAELLSLGGHYKHLYDLQSFS